MAIGMTSRSRTALGFFILSILILGFSQSARAQTGTNVALAANGGVATASSTYSANYPVSAVIDGDRKGLNWGTGGGWNDATSNAYPDWMQIDFGASQTINEIDLFTIQDNYSNPSAPTVSLQFSQYGVTDFEVQYWTGSTWADVPGGNVIGNRNVWRQFTFANITTSKIRVLVNNALGGYSRIAEIEAYTPPSLPGGTNAALASNGGVATVSSTYGAAYPASALNNGDRKGLNWASGGGWNDATGDAYPDWAQIDFNGNQTINEIDVFTIQDNFSSPVTPTLSMQFSQYGVTDFEVQYWTGSAWADVPNGNVTGTRNVWRQFTFANITTSKIRVLVNNALAGYSRLVEIEAYTPLQASGANVALSANGGVATASSTYSSNYPLTAVNNGDRKGLNWGAGGGWNDATGNVYPDWVQVDFSGSQTINEIDLFTIQDNYSSPATPTLSMQFSQYGVTDFQIQYWTGSTWADVPGGNVTGSRNVWRQFTFANITTSKIRVLINNALGGYSRIAEIEAYQAGGSGTPSPTPSPSPSPQAGVNVALAVNGGVPTATSTSSVNYPATAVNNGDRKGLNWGSGGGWNDGTSNSYPDWVQIDFNGSQTINEIDVFTIQDNWANPSTPTLSMQFSQYGITDFEVKYWTGSSWVDVPGGNVTGNRNVWRQFTFASVTTSSIRVQVNNALAGASRIVEIEAYQTPGSAAPSPTPSPTPSTGVWIAPRTDGQAGSGTNGDPYNGSTAAKLSTLISNIPPNTVVHFAAGDYYVSNLIPKPGVKFLGAGKDVTNFLWDGEPTGALISSYGGSDGAVISDLTLNGQQDIWGVTPMAVTIFDSNNVAIRNIRATNFRGGGTEAFPLVQFAQAVAVSGALIENCEVDHFFVSSGGASLLGLGHGGAGDPAVRISGIVQNNYIHDCPGTLQGIHGGGTNSVYQGNVVVGVDKAWYHDCWPASGSQVINNHFLNCTSYGIVATSMASGTDDPNNGFDGLIVANNRITMDPTVSSGVSGVLIQGSYVTNTQVYGNTVDKNTATWIQYGFNIKSPGSVVHDNVASPGFTNIP